MVQEMLAQGKTDTEMAEAIGCHRNSIQNYKAAIPPVAAAREDQLSRVTQMWQNIEADNTMTSAEKHLAFARWMKIEMDLTGTAAPTKSISAHFDAEHSIEYLQFKKATSGLSEEQRQKVLHYAESLERMYVAPVMDASWFPAPEQRQLSAAETVDEFDPTVEWRDACPTTET